ncbi:hypothetical protein [Streptomyces sp. CBMA29]|uniref:hypothetical protein n=1 Tax=Streptomyces sp. CBMA29 TaxID=1896314 RepID=UPI001662174B|nr:hypothetical protein [Streptomyces sp. CBMA29]
MGRVPSKNQSIEVEGNRMGVPNGTGGSGVRNETNADRKDNAAKAKQQGQKADLVQKMKKKVQGS